MEPATTSDDVMASRAAGDVWGAEPGPMPTIDRTPFESPMMSLLHVRTARTVAPLLERDARNGQGHPPPRAVFGVRLLRDEQLLRARRPKRCRLRHAACADEALHRLRGVLDPWRPIELLGGERAKQPPAPLGEREHRWLVRLRVDRSQLLHRLRREPLR